MPNRHERRAQAARARRSGPRAVIEMRLTAEHKQDLLAVTQQPGYHELLGELQAAALEWRVLYPEVRLVWKDTRGTLVTADLQDEYNKGYLAQNDGAYDLLTFMDERTGHRATTLMCQFVLGALGWMER